MSTTASDKNVQGPEKKREAEDISEIWSSIQSSKKDDPSDLPAPYVHPLLRRSSSSLSQKSLEVCTESLGSETGSDVFSDFDEYISSETVQEGHEEEQEEEEEDYFENIEVELKKELATVNYHCSVGAKSPPRSFPPPLPSISRRDGPCLHIRPRRSNGRLVVEAVPAPSQNYLHCHRQDGRLLLSFIETTFEEIYPDVQYTMTIGDETQVEADQEAGDGESSVEEDEEEMFDEDEDVVVEEEEEEEEEVEVVDKGIVVEVKVSRQPLAQRGGGGAAMRVHMSSLVINKFVGGKPVTNLNEEASKEEQQVEANHAASWSQRHQLQKTEANAGNWSANTAATEADVDGWGAGRSRPQVGAQENKMLFTTKKVMNRRALLHQVRTCRMQHHRPLFFWEPYCVASS